MDSQADITGSLEVFVPQRGRQNSSDNTRWIQGFQHKNWDTGREKSGIAALPCKCPPWSGERLMGEKMPPPLLTPGLSLRCRKRA